MNITRYTYKKAYEKHIDDRWSIINVDYMNAFLQILNQSLNEFILFQLREDLDVPEDDL